ncbi:unnamed protein product [Cylindrotheca closterium]|uniref:ubiquitinyl hydrolase 1 n=1 Tax=Cylindrotheca closterium TaxID=2856 RepID=A0AAD2JK06_9STRA|nr:unnamed protein product [Cylindrotheca closterium]
MNQTNDNDTNNTNPEETALIWKERGNHHYTNGQFGDASKAYQNGLDGLHNLDDSPLVIALNANLAMIRLKLKEFEEAVKLCNWILAKEPKNRKAKEGLCLDNNRTWSKETIRKVLNESMDDLKECLSFHEDESPGVDQKQNETYKTALARLQRICESYSSDNETLGKEKDTDNVSRKSCQRTAAEMKQDILRLLMARKGSREQRGEEAFFILSWNWWRDWCRYVDFFYHFAENDDRDRAKHVLQLLPSGATLPQMDENDDSSDDDSSCGSNFRLQPESIDNSCLFVPDSSLHLHWFCRPGQLHLKPNLVRGYHYEILPREVYFALRSWYGEVTPSICRRTTAAGVVNLYPPSRDRRRSRALQSCTACKAPYASLKCKSCMSVSYCGWECQESHWPFHRGSCTNGSLGGRQRTREGGMIGLNNLGNTCFMNSALQCLSHATPLTRYFLSNQFRKDINKTNVLGTGGKLAVAYDVVMKGLWMNDKATAISPTSLKRAIALFAPRFAGSLQHDAQEFLAYLLDGLHEDLNRITSAPYVEMPDVTDGQNMAIAGAGAWDAHRKRNDSLVFDTFYGQFQSTCICPKCRRVSVSFDAFNHVSLEIPQMESITVTIPVLFFGAVGGKMPLRHAITVSRRGSVADLKSKLAEQTGVSQSKIVFADIYNHTIYELLHDNKAVHKIGANDVVAAFEIEPFTSRSIHAVAVNTLVCKGDGEERDKTLIGYPLMISFHIDLPCQQVWERLWRMLRHYIGEKNGDDDIDDEDFKPEDILKIHIIDGKSKAPIDAFSTGDGKLTSLLPVHSSDSLLKFIGDKCTEDFLFLSLEWDARVARKGGSVIRPELFMAHAEHDSMQNVLRSQRNNHNRSAISLDQCFETFTNPERLDERNMWYCSSCKEHVKALKTMKLWRLPNILVVHLKRFAYKHTLRREKLDTFVDFPVDGLNMEPHCAKATSSIIDETVPAEYDLFGVINHYGRLGFGHYTAFAREWDENSMSNTFAAFDDSSVTKIGTRTHELISSAAYVLFYRRRSFN